MKHKGDLIITAENLAQYQALTEVSGSVKNCWPEEKRNDPGSAHQRP